MREQLDLPGDELKGLIRLLRIGAIENNETENRLDEDYKTVIVEEVTEDDEEEDGEDGEDGEDEEDANND